MMNVSLTQKHICRRTLFKCALILVMSALFALVSAGNVGGKNRKANKLYSQGKYDEALKVYDQALAVDSLDGKLKMNRGSALYRLSDFDEAEKSYLSALSNIAAKDKATLGDARYNLGNIQYKQGERLETNGNTADARKKYSQAVDNYIDALKQRPKDLDAKWNLELAREKVNLLETKQNDQQNQDKQDGEEDKKQDDQGGKEDNKNQNEKDEQDKQNAQNENEQNKDDKNQENQPQPRDQSEEDLKKEEANRLIEQFADDAEDLNKPVFQRGKVRQPEKDW